MREVYSLTNSELAKESLHLFNGLPGHGMLAAPLSLHPYSQMPSSVVAAPPPRRISRRHRSSSGARPGMSRSNSSSAILYQILLPYFNPAGHNTSPAPNPTERGFRFPERVHAPSHQRRPPGQTVINEDQVVVWLFVEVPVGDARKDVFGFPPRYSRSPGEPDRRVRWDHSVLDGDVDEAKCHLCTDPVYDFGQHTHTMFLVDLAPDLPENRGITAVNTTITPDEGDARLGGNIRADRDPPKPRPVGGDDSDVDVLMATLDVLIDGRAPPAFKRTLDAVVAEEVKGCTLPFTSPVP